MQEAKKLKKFDRKQEKKENEENVAEKARNTKLECEKILKNLREENIELLKLNAMYVTQNSKKYIKSDQLEINNYKFINDIVRKKLMKDLLNFNPTLHLIKLKSLAEVNSDIKKY